MGWLDANPAPATPDGSPNLQAFREGMRALGYVENRDFVIESRFADADERLAPALVKELLDSHVDLIVTVGTATTIAAKQATSTVPIVMTGGENTIGDGLIASLAHPGGNVTGLTHQPSAEFFAKGLQLLKDAAPRINRVAVFTASSLADRGLVFPTDGNLTLLSYRFARVRDLDNLHAIFAKMHEDQVNALFIFPDFPIFKFQDEIDQFIKLNRYPTMTQHKRFIETTALLYYYTNFIELRRHAATYVDKIIKGAKPADLPVEQPSKLEFIVNMKTARELGLTIPPSLTAFADRIIE